MAANFYVYPVQTFTGATVSANSGVVGGSFTLTQNFQAQQAGNLLVAVTNCAAAYTPALTGWTAVSSRTNSNQTSGGVYIKTSSAAAERIAGTTGGYGGIQVNCAIYEVAGAVMPPAVSGAVAVNTSNGTANPNPPALTSLANADYLVFAFKTGNTATTAGPSNMSNYEIPVSTISTAMTTFTGTSFDPATFTAGSNYWNAFTVAIKGAPAWNPQPPSGSRFWLPSDATSASVVGWFDASDDSTFTVDSSSRVSEWRSKVGGWSVYQATTANQPTRAPIGRNSLPTVMFSGNAVLSAPAPTSLPVGSDPGVLSSVASYLQYAADYASLVVYGTREGAMLRSISAHNTRVYAGHYGNDFETNSVWTGNDKIVVSSIDSTGLSSVYVDGNAAQTRQLSVLKTTSGTTFYVGGDQTGSSFWRNPIQELIVWNGNLNEDERQRLAGYYAWKWNLVGLLPSDHPYKTAAPTFAPTVLAPTRRAIRYVWAC